MSDGTPPTVDRPALSEEERATLRKTAYREFLTGDRELIARLLDERDALAAEVAVRDRLIARMDRFATFPVGLPLPPDEARVRNAVLARREATP